jgi:hypothetical protein
MVHGLDEVVIEPGIPGALEVCFKQILSRIAPTRFAAGRRTVPTSVNPRVNTSKHAVNSC